MVDMLEQKLSKEILSRITNAIYEVYGHDFRYYSAASLSRRLLVTMDQLKSVDIDTFMDDILSNKNSFKCLLGNLSINVTSMFRDPLMFRYLKESILPRLATYPHIRIWSAGVASGEEAYSIAILLKEAGLYHRSLIYATDFNPMVLCKAFKGQVELERMPEYTQKYMEAGGEKSFSNYYTTSVHYAHMREELRENIVFSSHNLATDHVFNEFHFIICRNVLIYFSEKLQESVINLFRLSLSPRGYLCLGSKESLDPKNREGRYFDCLSKMNQVYRVI